MIVTKEIYSKVYDYINPWGEALDTVAWAIRYFYHHNLGFTPSQAVFGRDMLFNLTPIADCHVVTAGNKWQVNIDNVCENARRGKHDLVYV